MISECLIDRTRNSVSMLRLSPDESGSVGIVSWLGLKRLCDVRFSPIVEVEAIWMKNTIDIVFRNASHLGGFITFYFEESNWEYAKKYSKK